MKLQELNNNIKTANKEYGYERFAKIVGYKKAYGALDRSGRVEKTLTKKQLLDWLAA